MIKEYVIKYAEQERTHWWFKARREILKSLISSVSLPTQAKILEVGAGTGMNMNYLYPEDATVIGVEPDKNMIQGFKCNERRKIIISAAENLPLEIKDNAFDMITMFDVLEHIKHDEGMLSKLHSKLKAGGHLFVSVPAYQWMWSDHDVVNLHYRRYGLKELKSKLTNNGFKIIRASFFNSILFPFIAFVRVSVNASRMFSTKKNKARKSSLEYNCEILNSAFYHIFRQEEKLLKQVNLPFGGSIFLLATKE